MEGYENVQRVRPRGLIMAAISHVFTIARVAEMLGEDEEWLFELSINMFPKMAACISSDLATRERRALRTSASNA